MVLNVEQASEWNWLSQKEGSQKNYRKEMKWLFTLRVFFVIVFWFLLHALYKMVSLWHFHTCWSCFTPMSHIPVLIPKYTTFSLLCSCHFPSQLWMPENICILCLYSPTVHLSWCSPALSIFLQAAQIHLPSWVNTVFCLYHIVFLPSPISGYLGWLTNLCSVLIARINKSIHLYVLYAANVSVQGW